MAKPRELYNGAAPQAMSMMGAGIAEAYGKAGEIEGRGYAALGQAIGQGITSIAGYLKEAKDRDAKIKSYEGLLGNDVGRSMLGLNKQQAESFLASTKDMKPSERLNLLSTVIPARLSQTMEMQKVGMQESGATGREVLQQQGAKERAVIAALASTAKKQTYELPTMNFDNPFGSKALDLPAAGAATETSGTGAMGLSEFLKSKGLPSTTKITPELHDEYMASPFYLK